MEVSTKPTMSTEQEQINRRITRLLEDHRAHPIRLHLDQRQIEFFRLSPQAYDKKLFHDWRNGDVDSIGSYAIDNLLSCIHGQGVQRRQLNLVFPIAFCGSTLIARYLHHLDGGPVYREPGLISHLSTLKHGNFSRLQRDDWDKALEVVLHLLCRTDSAASPGMKLNDICINLVDELLAWHPATRGVVLYSSLVDYLVAILKVPGRRQWARKRIASCDQEVLGQLKDVDPEPLTDAQSTAYLWLARMQTFKAAIDKHGDRMRSLNRNHLINIPEQVLHAACHFYETPVDAQRIADVVAIQGGMHAKSFDALDLRRDKIRRLKLKQQFASEIEEGYAWALEHCGEDGFPESLPAPLLESL